MMINNTRHDEMKIIDCTLRYKFWIWSVVKAIFSFLAITMKVMVPMQMRIMAKISVLTILSFSTTAEITVLNIIEIALEHPKNI